MRVTSGGNVADHQLLRVDRGEAASTAESLMDALPAIGRSAQFRVKNSCGDGLLNPTSIIIMSSTTRAATTSAADLPFSSPAGFLHVANRGALDWQRAGSQPAS